MGLFSKKKREPRVITVGKAVQTMKGSINDRGEIEGVTEEFLETFKKAGIA